MKIVNYPRGYPASKLKLPEATDYFDFPSSMLAFAESLPTSHLMSIDNQVFFRRRNKALTLITYFCDSERLAILLAALQINQFTVKSLNYVNKPMEAFERNSYGNEYWTDRSWTLDNVIGSSKRSVAYKLRTAYKRGGEKYYTSIDCVNREKVLELFEEWYQAAKQRHFMVVRGHYLRYIDRYYEFFALPNNVHLVHIHRKADDKLVGIIGYEYYGNYAQMTLGKHLIGEDYYLPYFFWITAIQTMLAAPFVRKLFLGTTADDLKQQLGLCSYKSYKLRL